MGHNQEQQRLLAARKVNFQEIRLASAQGRSGTQYGRQESPQWRAVLESPRQKQTEPPASAGNVVDSQSVMMENVGLESLNRLPELANEGADAYKRCNIL